MTTKHFQAIFYLILGLCILTIVVSFTAFDFIELDAATNWTMRYFALPILIAMTPTCSFVYLKFIRQYEKKDYISEILVKFRTVFRVIILTLGMTIIVSGTTFSLIILTNGYLGESKTITINAHVLESRITGEGLWRGITKHYIKIKDQQLDRIVELKVDRVYKVGESFNKTMKIGKWGLLYSEK